MPGVPDEARGPYEVLRTNTCEAQLRETAFYLLEEAGLPSSEAFLDRIGKACEGLSRFPRLGRVPRWGSLARRGFRMLEVGSYLVFYTADDERRQVVAHAVVRGGRRYEGLL